MLKKIITFLIVSSAFFVFPKTAYGFGITPAEIFATELKPGSHYEREIIVTRPPDEVNEDLTVVLEPDLGEIESWFRFDPGLEFEFPSGRNTTTFKVIIDVSQDAGINNFRGQITAKGLTDNLASEGVTIIKGAVLGVDLETTDSEVTSLKVLNIETPEVNSGDPVRLLMNIQNEGNTTAAPDEVRLEVMDLVENPIETLSDTSLEEIEPFTTKVIQAEFNSNLEEGQYRVDASVFHQGEEISNKRMVLTVNAAPAQVAESIDQAQFAQASSVDRQTALALTIFGTLLLAIILGLYIRMPKESDPNIEKRLSKLMHHNKLLTWFLVVASMSLITAGFYFYLAAGTQNLPPASEEVGQETSNEVNPTQTPDDELSEIEESTSESDVRGVSTEVESTASPLRVDRPGTPGLYPIFAEPSFGSEIIYEAQPGENFDANFLEDGWYRVEIDDGTMGWLHETSISNR